MPVKTAAIIPEVFFGEADSTRSNSKEAS